MNEHDESETRELWDRLAEDWRIQVGRDGDANRRLNSDPVLSALLDRLQAREAVTSPVCVGSPRAIIMATTASPILSPILAPRRTCPIFYLVRNEPTLIRTSPAGAC
jgi:hypothetical protein